LNGKTKLRDFKEIYNKAKEKDRGDVYSDVALDHFLNPRNVGSIEGADAYAKVGEPSCGDSLEIFLKLDDDKETITDVRFKVFGCPGAIATSSVATELVKGKDVMFALSLSDDDIIEALGGLPDGKKHCSILSVMALKTALAEFVIRQYAISEGIVKDDDE
jgi:nitrogen fixation NifU-like protein